MPERRLHPAAVAVYSANALQNLAFPLLIIAAVTLLGGRLDGDGLRRTVLYGAIGLATSLASGITRWRTTTYSVSDGTIRHRTGLLHVKQTHIPLDRVEALDTHQGPVQRLFGVQAVDVQTGAGAKGGEIALPALRPEEVRALRETVGARGPEGPAGPERRLGGRDLLVTALTAGQVGIVLPVLAGASQVAQQFFEEHGGERQALDLLPDTETGWLAVAAGLLLVAWAISAAGAAVAFGGFSVTRDGERLRIRRGVVQRREATVPVGRVRAVRVVEGLLRRPFGLAALHVEVTGYAEEAAAARTLFPLVRVGDVPAFLAELLPELADDPRGLARPPARARRRYLLTPALIGLVVAAAAWIAVGPWALVTVPAGVAYGWLGWAAAGWRLSDGRLAVRARRGLARATVLAPARLRESHEQAQSLLQRRAGLADLEVSFGKGTRAHIRHLDAGDVRTAWETLAAM